MVRTPIHVHAVILALLLAATAAVYAPLRDAPFVYEDENWLAVVADPVTFAPRPSRALTYATFHWTYERVQFAPAVWHLTNVGLHLVNGVLVYAVAGAVVGATPALGAAGLFLLHPLNAEAVSYVSARTDLLAATFTLLAVWIALGRRRWIWRGIGCALALAGAALSKEIGVVGVPLVLLTILCWRRTSVPWMSPLLAGLWVALGACIGAMWDQLQAYVGLSSWTSGSVLSAPEYALRQAGMVWKFLLLACWPSALTIDHDVMALGSIWLALSALGVTVAALSAVATWRRTPAITWTVGWVAIAVAPRFLVGTNEFLNEHQMYMALIGVWIAIATSATHAWRAILREADKDFWSLYRDEATMLLRNQEGA